MTTKQLKADFAHFLKMIAPRLRKNERNISAFDFAEEHGAHYVIHRPSGASWSAIETQDGIDFEELDIGDLDS